MVLVMKGIHPPDNIQNGGSPGGEMPLISALAGPWHRLRGLLICDHGVSILMTNHGVGYAFLAETTFCVSLFCDYNF
jgi:hypothetical protein